MASWYGIRIEVLFLSLSLTLLFPSPFPVRSSKSSVMSWPPSFQPYFFFNSLSLLITRTLTPTKPSSRILLTHPSQSLPHHNLLFSFFFSLFSFLFFSHHLHPPPFPFLLSHQSTQVINHGAHANFHLPLPRPDRHLLRQHNRRRLRWSLRLLLPKVARCSAALPY